MFVSETIELKSTSTLSIHLLTLINDDSDVKSNITTTPSTRRKYCFVMLRNLQIKVRSFFPRHWLFKNNFKFHMLQVVW